MLFSIDNKVYHLGIGWTDEYAYGDWWKSSDLIKKLESWGLTHPKGTVNPPSGVSDDPFKDQPDIGFGPE